MVLADGIEKLVLFAAKIEDLSPVEPFAVAINPAAVIFGFEDVNSLLIDGEAIDLGELA